MPLKELKQKLLIKNTFVIQQIYLHLFHFTHTLLPLVSILVSPFSALCCVNISSYQ